MIVTCFSSLTATLVRAAGRRNQLIWMGVLPGDIGNLSLANLGLSRDYVQGVADAA